ncbi:YihY/virulence factor BrkB family protein [Salinibacterium sp. SYSU T00001]|uniref:YihY/virulence factor BrkB family protein n=1 Tax=Homoserinimonas sedimenticola TaxID=2986805 RepID=UPI002236AD78|nr:YihY/virulence factor BrkB family protein [Salinibacterium sedimenticola]MCW4385764.1 YihY/virulence factor BrkB family protein [Salinibacterium sedimenticola]
MPAPDDDRKPEGPTDIRPHGWGYAAKRVIREFIDDDCITLAAGLTYYAVLSIFPALLALVSTLGLFGQGQQTVDALLEIVRNFASDSVANTIEDPVRQLADSPGAGLAFFLGLAGAIWSASVYVNAFGKAMNRIYEVEEGRPIWKLRPIMLLITVIMLLIAMVMAVLLVASGPVADAIGSFIGLSDAVVTAWSILKWPVLVLFAVLLLAVLYYATPNVRQPHWRWITPGSIIALVVLALASLGFFFYVSNFGNYNATYGSLGGIIVLLLWLWIANLAFLLGGEFDAELERSRQLQGGIEAEDQLRLPVRDDRQIKKNAEKDRALAEEGRRMRRRRGRRE